MALRLLCILFGIVVGLGASLLLPGHPAITLLLAGSLSLAGALGGELTAEWLLPSEILRPSAFALSALGALAVLLAYGVMTQ